MQEFQQGMKVVRACPIKIFATGKGGQMSRMWYPYKLQKHGEIDIGATHTCLEYMVDSAIGDDDVTNRDVIETAMETDATYVVAKDYLHNRQKTTESVKEFFDLYEKSDCRAIPLVPLQPPHDDHFDELPDYTRYMVGGVKNADPEEQVEACRALRQKAGDVYIHGLGMGYSLTFIRAVRETPGMVDSIDNTTALQAINSGHIVDGLAEQRDFIVPQGDDTTTIAAYHVKNQLLQLNYAMSPLCTDERIEQGFKLEKNQSQLSDAVA